MARTAMAKGALRGLFTGCVILLATTTTWAAADPRVAGILAYKPRQKDVQVSQVAPEEYEACEVKVLPGTKPNASGFLLLDAKKKPLRRFFDTDGDKQIDVWSYFLDGVEVYREIDTNFNKEPDQFRWFNSAGMKWGISTKENGKIDYWRMISAEEVGQELFEALATKDFSRVQALLISEAELRALKVSADYAQQLLGKQKKIGEKFQEVLGKAAGLDDKARLLRVEIETPNAVPAEAVGSDQDIIKHPPRTVLYESSAKKHEWIRTGEMIQVGLAWRLVDGPGLQTIDTPTAPTNPKLKEYLDKLHALDANPPAPLAAPKVDTAVQNYNLARIALIQEILKHDEPKNRESWIKQMFDNLSAAGQAGSEAALKQLTALKDQMESTMPGSNLAAYGVFRELWAHYSIELANAKTAQAIGKVQGEWHDKLVKFAQTYPKADDTPDALNQLAMDAEYNGKDEEAKRWYTQIYSNFPEHHLAEKSRGAERRLGLIGRPLELAGPQLVGGANFDVTAHKGKVVIVYYWTSKVAVCKVDFQLLKKIHADYGAKGVEIVGVSLDDNAADAQKFLQETQAPGTHLFQAAKDGVGLNSPLAVFYGINSLPNVFLVGRDGRVLNRTLQVSDLENELKKAL